MCIIFIAHHVHPKYPLIIAANRDEFLDRPTESMKIWTNDRDTGQNQQREQQKNSGEEHRRRRVTLAGRDLVAGGTWLGIDLPDGEDTHDSGGDKIEDGGGKYSDSVLPRWIAITNFREVIDPGRPSRGGLLMEYLDGDVPSASTFVSSLQPRGNKYNGFNLLVGDKSGIYYYGNRAKNDQVSNDPQPLSRGIYGLSNGLLDSPWPKVERGKEMLRLLCQKDLKEPTSSVESFHEELMSILGDQTQPASDDMLPHTGIGLSFERQLSSIFLPGGLYQGKNYGTMSSATILVDVDGKMSVLERTWRTGEDCWFRFDANGNAEDRVENVCVSHTP
mmetsp:Transcript_14266/g.30464  ORF Transcript_14266/g.30464 Transcript_14266/m.30464 type:complete len:333 (-) Transcript_14266:70-1068(-)